MYGRSIGGIAASHLVQKFPQYIRAFIGDRTLGSFEDLITKRYRQGHIIRTIFRFWTCWWKVNNGAAEFLNNTNCYKIHCFDLNDDVVDIMASHHHEIAKNFSQMQVRAMKPRLPTSLGDRLVKAPDSTTLKQ